MVSPSFGDVVRRARREPSFRGKLIYFPEEIIEEYGLTGAEATAVSTCDLTGLRIRDEDLRLEAELVFDLHDMSAGE